MAKLQYIHQNPVKAGFVENPAFTCLPKYINVASLSLAAKIFPPSAYGSIFAANFSAIKLNIVACLPTGKCHLFFPAFKRGRSATIPKCYLENHC
jgi:hypothetical protein